MTDVNTYDTHAPKLIERGLYPLAIAPGTKQPGHWVPSLGRFELTQGWTHPRRPATTSAQPGAGIGLRCGLQPDGTHVIAIDWDNDAAAIAAMDKFPASATKEGSRGFTVIYRSSKPVPSHDYKLNGAVAV